MPKDTSPQSDPNPSEEKADEMEKRELDKNAVVNQDPFALLAYDTAGRPRHDESCKDDFLLQRGVRPKKQWDVPANYQRPDRRGGGSVQRPSSKNRKLQQQQQNENPDATP